jgi:hypothetical protein
MDPKTSMLMVCGGGVTLAFIVAFMMKMRLTLSTTLAELSLRYVP